MDLELAEVASLNVALIEELADLRATLEACENKWYNEGFADAEEGVEPSRRLDNYLFKKAGWLSCTF